MQLCPKCQTRPGVPMFNLVGPCDPCYGIKARSANPSQKHGRWLNDRVWLQTDSGPPPEGWTSVSWLTVGQYDEVYVASRPCGMSSRRYVDPRTPPVTTRKDGNAGNLTTGEHWPTAYFHAAYYYY